MLIVPAVFLPPPPMLTILIEKLKSFEYSFVLSCLVDSLVNAKIRNLKILTKVLKFGQN